MQRRSLDYSAFDVGQGVRHDKGALVDPARDRLDFADFQPGDDAIQGCRAPRSSSRRGRDTR